ncbi:MAG TPA: sensor histidine kinase [Puia sp.]|nr:sensor histidine kinase [Puia sp.]
MRSYYKYLPGIRILLLFCCYDGNAMPFQDKRDVVAHNIDTSATRWLSGCMDSREKGEYTSALEEGLRAVKAYQQSGDKANAARTYMEISQIYQYLGEQKNSPAYVAQGIGYARTAYDAYTGIQDTAGEVISRNVQGMLYRSMALLGKPVYYDSAITCYQEAMAMISPSGKGRQYAGFLYNNISQVITEYKKDYPAALHYLQEAVLFNKQINNIIKLSYNYANISHVYQQMGDKRSSLEYAYKALNLARQINTANRLLNIYLQLYNSYRSFGIADSALRYYVLYDSMRDSITNLATTRQIAEVQTKYETEKNKAQIIELKSRNSIQDKRIILLVTGVCLLLVFLVGLFLLYRHVRGQKYLILQQSRQLEIMMKELHHRVKNNLQIVTSLLSLQSYRLRDDEALEAIRLSQHRVQAMSFIHQRLYMGEENRMVDMEEYLQDLAKSLVTAYGYANLDFDLQISVSRKWLDVDQALPMGLIANEVITNALKYAYTDNEHPALHIELKEQEGSLLFVLKDNGCGWDEKKWLQAGESFGKQLVGSLCNQLNATEKLAIDKGAAFIFTIPLEGAA